MRESEVANISSDEAKFADKRVCSVGAASGGAMTPLTDTAERSPDWSSSSLGEGDVPRPCRRRSLPVYALHRFKTMAGFKKKGRGDNISSSMKCIKSEADLARATEQHHRCTATRSGVRTLKGRKYEDKSNEDKFFAIEDVFASMTADAADTPAGGPPAALGKVGVFGVFDGHGGQSCSVFVSQHLPHAIASSPAWARLNNGNVAGKAIGHNHQGRGRTTPPAADARPSHWAHRVVTDPEGEHLDGLLPDVMKEATLDGFRRTQEGFAEFARVNGKNSGSTAVVALVCRGHLVIANLGDSGGLFHNDQALVGTMGEPCTFRTESHTMHNLEERARLEAAGGTFTDGRLFGRLVPTRTFGNQDVRSIEEGVLLAVPEVSVHRIEPATQVPFLVLGSDGLWGSVSASKVIDIVRAEARRQSKQKADKMPLRMAESLTREAARGTSGDDVTAIVVLFG